MYPYTCGPNLMTQQQFPILLLSAQISSLQCSLHFLPGKPSEVYRLFSLSFCLALKEQLLNTCFLHNLVASDCLKEFMSVLCAKSLTLQQVYILKISRLLVISFSKTIHLEVFKRQAIFYMMTEG